MVSVRKLMGGHTPGKCNLVGSVFSISECDNLLRIIPFLEVHKTIRIGEISE